MLVGKMTNILCSYSLSDQFPHKLSMQEGKFLQYDQIILISEFFSIYRYFLQLHCFISKRNFQITHKFLLSWNLSHCVLINQNTTFSNLQFSFWCHFLRLKSYPILAGSLLFPHKKVKNITKCFLIFSKIHLLKIWYFTELPNQIFN